MEINKHTKIILLAVILIVFSYIISSFFIFSPDSDTKLYFEYGERILNKEIPYKDFFVVYPPLSLISFFLPSLFTENVFTYNILFGIEMIFFLALTIYLLCLISKELKKDYKLVIFYSLMFVLFLIYVITKRYDILPVFLTVLSIYFLFKEKYKLSALFFACGVLAKLYPIIFLPLYLIYILKKENLKKTLIFFIFFVFSFLMILLPFLLTAPPRQAGFYSFSYHFTRPLHVESFYGSALLLLEKTNISFLQAPLKNDIYGWTIYSPLSPIILPLSTILILIFFAFFTKKLWQKKEISEKLFLKYILLFLLVFVSLNKVFSPQFLIWLLPFLAFCLGSKELKIMLLIAALTFIIYPLFYGALIKKEIWILVILFLRNSLLVFLLFNLLLKNNYKEIKRE